MRTHSLVKSVFLLGFILIIGFALMMDASARSSKRHALPQDVYDRIPHSISTTEKVIVIDPSVHVWAAYDANGNLERAGLATAGANYCPDIRRGCRTKVGSFRINSLGSSGCKSSRYPRPRGGAPMPYCMFFNGNQALHGSSAGNVRNANLSHGCVRLKVEDAKWIRFDFADVGTKVIVKSY